VLSPGEIHFVQKQRMEKLDLTKKFKSYYTAKPQPEIIELPSVPYLTITGKGDPSSRAFADKLETLYPVAYAIKFMAKVTAHDFTVPKLEGLWWFDDERFGTLTMEEAPLRIPRDEWYWRLLIRMPDFVTEAMVEEAKATVSKKKNIPSVAETSLYTLAEGKVLQMLHVGPFDREPETLLQMQKFIEKHNLKKNGLHHEIYLSDFRKTAPEKLKTILREPVK
jgi:hypothetical protein